MNNPGITYTFPADFRHEALRGFLAVEGTAVVRGGAWIDGSGDIRWRPRQVGIEFPHGPDGRPFSIAVQEYPDLRRLAYEQVLGDFEISSTHGVERTTDYMNLRTGEPIQFGRISLASTDAKCSKAAAAAAAADPRGYITVFAVVKHPQHGYVGVTPLELTVLELPEVEGWDFLEDQP